MIITMASFKGGVGKSTSAVHIAAHLAKSAKTLLVDGDPNRSVTRWASQGRLPFTVASEAQATMHARNYEHIVIDTKARPDPEDLREIIGRYQAQVFLLRHEFKVWIRPRKSTRNGWKGKSASA